MIYSNYTNRIRNIVQENRQKKILLKGLEDVFGTKPPDKKQLFHEQRLFSDQLHINTQPLGMILQPEHLKDEKVGVHPDFKHLKGTDNTENHNIVSVFIDIQG